MSKKEINGGVIGSIFGCYHFEWNIPYFHKLPAQDRYFIESPPFASLGANWQLTLYPKGYTHGYISLYLRMLNLEIKEKEVNLVLGVRKKSGTVEEMAKWTHVFSKTNLICGETEFLSLDVLHRRRSDLLYLNDLTVTCRIEDPLKEDEPLMPPSLKLTELETLSLDLKDFFLNKKKCDVILKVEDVEFPANKAILMARSPVFAAMFEHGMMEDETGSVDIPDCDSDSFEYFLEYIYTGQLEKLSFENALSIYAIADKYDVPKLKTFCFACLIDGLTPDNVCDVLNLSERYNDSELFLATTTFFDILKMR